MVMSTDTAAAAPRHRWESWRRAQLVGVGFDDTLATRIAADPGIDLHQILDLVSRGCPPALAARIASPLTARDGQELRCQR